MRQEVGKTDETEWEDEHIGRENWLKSHDKSRNGCANACTCEKAVKGNQTLRSQIEVKIWTQQHAL
jgi:hypothetical protein